MDKQEYREIVGDIRRAYDLGEYDKVLMYADELDMRRVSDSRVLEMISDSHAAMGDLGTAREMLLKAYEKTPMGRKIAYKLSELSIQLGDLDGAVDFYEDFCKMAPHDNDRFLLKYKIGKAGGVGKEDLVKVLAAYCSREVDEKWMAELAATYDELGETEKCNEVCDDIILWFADGEYVQQALELKEKNGVLTEAQKGKLEQMKVLAATRTIPKPEEELPEIEILDDDRNFRPGTMDEDGFTEDDLDSFLEEVITIEDATTPPEPVKAADMAEVSSAEIDPETEVIPVEEIREAADYAPDAAANIEEAKYEAKKAATIEAAMMGTMTPPPAPVEEEEPVVSQPFGMAFKAVPTEPFSAKPASEELNNEPVIEEIELRTAPVHAEVREHIAENMDQPEPEEVPDILAVPEPPEQEAFEEEPAAEEAAAQEPLFKTTTPNGKPFSNIVAMQSARTAPPKDETSFWKMPEELTFDEEEGNDEFAEPVYGSHRWFEEKTEPEPEFEEPVFGAHRFVPQPEVEEEPYAEDVVIEQVEPEPIAIEAAEDDVLPEHFSTIRTTSSGAEIMGMYAAAKSAGTADNLSAQAAFVKKPALGGRKTLPPEMFADPTAEPEYYEGPEYFEEPEAGFVPEPGFEPAAEEPAEEPQIQMPAFAEDATQKIARFEREKVTEEPHDAETEYIPAEEVQDIIAAEEREEADIEAAGSQMVAELFADDPFMTDLEEPQESEAAPAPSAAPEVVFLHDQKEEPESVISPEAVTAAMEEPAAAPFAAAEPVPEAAPFAATEPAPEAAPFTEAEPVMEEPASEEPEEDRPSPFMFSVMPHESIEEVVPEVVKERAEKQEEERELEALLDEEMAGFEEALQKFDKEQQEAAVYEAPEAAAPIIEEAPAAETAPIIEEAPAAETAPIIEEAPAAEPFAEAAPFAEAEPVMEEPAAEPFAEAAPFAEDAHKVAPEEFAEAFEEPSFTAAVPEAPQAEEAPQPEAEPSVFIPLNQLSAESGKVITPITEKNIAVAEVEAEAESFDDILDEAESEFEGAVQEFELAHSETADDEWESAELLVDEDPIVEITASIPNMEEELEAAFEEPVFEEPSYEEPAFEEPAFEEPSYEEPAFEEPSFEEPVFEEPSFEEPVFEEPSFEEPQPELSDFEKAMLAFEESNRAVPEDEFSPDELDETMDEFMDEGIEPWEEPEFGMPDFAESEFEKPEYLGNAFESDEDAETVKALMESIEDKEVQELSGFEKALMEFEREQAAAAGITPAFGEPEYEPEEPAFAEPEIAEPVFEEPAAEEPAAKPVFAEPVPAAAAPEAPSYQLPDDLREELAEFLLIDGMESRICNTIGSIIDRKRSGDPTGGHLIVTGDAKSGKTYLTISIIKAVGKEIGSATGRVAKVQADALNGKDMNKVFGKISGSDLIIENAGYLNDITVTTLIEALKTSGTSSMVVLEGNQLGIENITTKHPELLNVFHTRLNLNELTLSQWADLACDYAESKGYEVGDMALLALHAKIDEMNLPTTRLVTEDVQGIIDKAIEKAKKRSSGRLFGGKKNKGNANELDETDFM